MIANDQDLKSALDLNLQFTNYLISKVDKLTDEIAFMSPVEFNEAYRYIPSSVSPRFAGPIDISRTPFWIEPLECLDVRSDVREVAIIKGVQTGYTTIPLEGGIFYVAGHVRTAPAMFATADLGLSNARMKLNILPMFQQSNMGHIFMSSDETSTRKRGATKEQIEWEGGGYLIPYGAQNADKARQNTIWFLFMDEISAWPDLRDGDSVKLFKDRCSGVWDQRKILMGSTPGILGSCKIHKEFLRGDQRKYFVRCLKCGFPQILRKDGKHEGRDYGLRWEYLENGSLDIESVRYECANCNHAHMEHDKTKLFALDNAEWQPTATAVQKDIRSYQLSALYSPAGFQPWYKAVTAWLDAWDVKNNRRRDVAALQVFYNNILAEPFEIFGSKIDFKQASAHRRMFYSKGTINNTEIEKHTGSPILAVIMTVDCHKDNLAVAIWGCTKDLTIWCIDYQRFYDTSATGHETLDGVGWASLSELIDSKEYIANDGKKYRISSTFIDASWKTEVVYGFCSQYSAGVYPIFGRDKIGKSSSLTEFKEYRAKSGILCYNINVDYYKDRIAPVLRREWSKDHGKQGPYTFNAPIDITDKELTELTVEMLRSKQEPNGSLTYYWHRPHGVENELWDLLVYAHAGFEIIAWSIWIRAFEAETIDWEEYWAYLERESLFYE